MRKKIEGQLFRTFVEHSSDIIVLLNLEGIITYINPAMERVLGFKPEERIGAKGFELVHPDDMKFLADAFNTLSMETNSPVIQGELRLCHKDGSWHTLEAIGSNLVNNNVVEAIIVNYRDISERKKAEDALLESERRYKLITEKMTDIVWIANMDLRIIYITPSIQTVRGFSPEERMFLTVDQILTPDSKAICFETLARELAIEEQGHGDPNRIVTVVFEYYNKNGSTTWMETIMSGIRNDQGVLIGIHGVSRDITKRRQAEEKLQQTIESLKKAVGTTIQVLVSALESKDTYTANHQSRSANLACAIAIEMGLSQEKIDGIRMAGIIHDIGKLSIPAEILSKPTKLKEIEFSLIKQHSRSGYEMLKNVESPWPLAEIVYQHHERMNGSGYPRNLKGDEILMESRILAVADVVEAMASHRPYRPNLGIEAALEEIKKNKGIFYDDTVADACLRLFQEKGFKFQEA